jgi:ribosome maturation factor RimP
MPGRTETHTGLDATDRVRELALPAVESAGCQLWDVALVGPRGKQQLRVYIDSPEGVDLERCALVSRQLRPVLDALVPEFGELELEVSSPGAERVLRGMNDYLRYVGRRVNVRFATGDSETVVEGPLTSVSDEAITVEARGGRLMQVPVDSIQHVRGAVDFGAPREPKR